MIARRAAGEPVQLIKGYAVFRGLEILASPGVFVPRDSTEYLAEQAVRRLRRRHEPVAVDLATGGGTVALAIANEVASACTAPTSPRPRSARRNAERLDLAADFHVGDVYRVAEKARGRGRRRDAAPPYVALGDTGAARNPPVRATLTDKSRTAWG